GERAAVPPPDQLLVGFDRAEELVDEPALADARLADEGDELERAVVAHARERVDEHVDLARAADKSRPRHTHVDFEPRARLHGFPHRDTLGLALRLDRLRLAVLDRALW